MSQLISFFANFICCSFFPIIRGYLDSTLLPPVLVKSFSICLSVCLPVIFNVEGEGKHWLWHKHDAKTRGKEQQTMSYLEKQRSPFRREGKTKRLEERERVCKSYNRLYLVSSLTNPLCQSLASKLDCLSWLDFGPWASPANQINWISNVRN